MIRNNKNEGLNGDLIIHFNIVFSILDKRREYLKKF